MKVQLLILEGALRNHCNMRNNALIFLMCLKYFTPVHTKVKATFYAVKFKIFMNYIVICIQGNLPTGLLLPLKINQPN